MTVFWHFKGKKPKKNILEGFGEENLDELDSHTSHRGRRPLHVQKKFSKIYRELQSWIATIATEAEGLCTYRKKKINRKESCYDKRSYVIGEQAKMGSDSETMYPVLQA